MTDETFPHEIWADLDHWIEGPAASDLRAQGYMKYLRADHVDALLKAEREKALREAAEVCFAEKWKPKCSTDWVLARVKGHILALIEKDATDG